MAVCLAHPRYDCAGASRRVGAKNILRVGCQEDRAFGVTEAAPSSVDRMCEAKPDSARKCRERARTHARTNGTRTNVPRAQQLACVKRSASVARHGRQKTPLPLRCKYQQRHGNTHCDGRSSWAEEHSQFLYHSCVLGTLTLTATDTQHTPKGHARRSWKAWSGINRPCPSSCGSVCWRSGRR